MSTEFNQDFFTLFGIAPGFHLDPLALETAYHDLQTRVHPDRFAHLSDADKRVSMQWATRINEAYRTLKNPLSRAQYVLLLKGVDTATESNTAMPPAFLMEQMEWREAVEEAREAAEVGELEGLHKRLLAHSREVRGHLAVQLDDERDYEAAADTVRRLMFIDKLQQEIDEALLALEN